jgi:hypothetical protein
MLDGPIHKRIFPDGRLLPPTPNFPIMIYPANMYYVCIAVYVLIAVLL